VRVNGHDATVVGVMPPGFAFPVKEQVWVALDTDTKKIARGKAAGLEVFGRLKPGVDMAQARAEFDALVKREAAAFPDTAVGEEAVVKPYRDEFIGRNTRRMLFTMLVAVVLVLGIACANVANLMLARAAARTRENAIRSALGASRRRIVMQTLLESVLIALAGGAIGLALAYFGGEATMRALASSEDPPPYWFLDYRIDALSVVFTLSVALVSAVLAGLLPALRASSGNAARTMREGGAGQIGAMGRLARVLVSAEVAACMALMVTAGLTVRSVLAVEQLDLGFDPSGLLTGRIALFEASYKSEADVLQFQDRLERKLLEIPGASAAAVASSVPMSFAGGDFVQLEGQVVAKPDELPPMAQVAVSTRYFETLDIPLQRGRLFDSRDGAESEHVIVVSHGMAEKLWPGIDPVGKRVKLGRTDTGQPWLTVVGVVGDVIQASGRIHRPAYYLPLSQSPTRFMSFLLRTPGDVAAFAAPARAAVESIDRDLPVYWMRGVDAWVDIATFDHRLSASLFGMFGAFAVLLASAGIYAVLAYAVSRRTREIGVMRALGARDRGVLRAVFGQSARQLALGLAVGVVMALGFGQLIGRTLEGVSGYDPLTFVSVGVLLSLVALSAALIPTRRALRIEPMTALRYE
jgi:predicted permease